MKRYFVKIKRIISLYPYLLFTTLFLGIFLLVSLPSAAQSDEKDSRDSFIPVLIIIEGGTGAGEEIGLYLSQKLVVNDFGVTIGIIPYLNQKGLISSDSQVKELRNLYNLYPEKISFALQGLEHLENELKKPLPEQIHILSRAQSIFTQAFNRDRYDYFLLATTLVPPYGQYNRDTAAAARQAGIKMIIGNEINGSKGYALLECDVAEIHPDNEASMIGDWQSLKIRSPEELIKSMTGALKESAAENPLVMIINAGILYNQLGAENAKRYIDTLISLLDQLRQRKKVQFITSAEYYGKFVGGKQYIVLRLDDYQTPYKKRLFEKVVSRITELDVPLTISIIPHETDRLSKDPEGVNYLNSMLGKGLIEVALHGYDHREGAEFTFSLNEQTDILRDALAESEKILSYHQIFSLVLPCNASNEFTSKAIKIVNKEGHQVRVFSSGIGDKYIFGFDPEGIYHISRTISSVKSYTPPYPLYSVEEILAAIGYDDAVLSIDVLGLEKEEQQNIILEVIKHLKERPNVEFVTLRDLYFNIDPTLRLALYAWRYFKENTDSTGLVYSVVLIDDDYIYRYPVTTMWDVASSLLGIVSAERLGIISFKEGVHRTKRILDFLQRCELYQNKYPNFDYYVRTGQVVKQRQGVAWDDVARMLTALRIVGNHYPSLKSKCSNIVGRWNLAFLETLYQPSNEKKLNELKRSPYWDYMNASFVLWGYRDESASFWTRLLNKIHGLFSKIEPDYKDKLLIPESYILEAIEMGPTKKSKEILHLIQNLQEARYKDEGIITCLSEGELDREPWFVYCGLVVSEEDSTVWPVVKSIGKDSKSYPEYRFISSKAAIAWQALKENDYTRLCYDLIGEKTVNYQFGFYTGIYEGNHQINKSLSVNTNGIILESLWFKKGGKKPLIYPEEAKVSEIEENMFSRAKKRTKDFYWYILKKLKVKTEKNLH